MRYALTPDWVIPIHPRGRVLTDHSLVVEEEKIAALLPTESLGQAFPNIPETRLPGHALLPGFVNLHTHAGMTLLRGFADDLPLKQWLQTKIWPQEAKHLGPDFVRVGSQLACLEFLLSGITTFNDMYFYPEITAEVVVESGLRACLGITVLEFATPYASDADAYLHQGLNIRDAFRHESRLSFSLAPHAPYTVSDNTFQKVLTFAEQLDLPIHLHVNETSEEIATSLKDTGRRPIERLLGLGIVGPRLIAVHAVHLSSLELQLFAQHGVSIAHCPHSNLKLGSGIAPIAEALQLGINVGIGTDSSASNNQLNMLQEMRTAALLAKGVQQDASVLPAEEALTLATWGGAKALGLDNQIGSLEVGKYADMIAIRLDPLETQPGFHPISQIVYSASREAISHVWVNGEQVLRDRNPIGLDLPGILSSTHAWQKILENP